MWSDLDDADAFAAADDEDDDVGDAGWRVGQTSNLQLQFILRENRNV